MNDPQRILVTGGAGFIGSATVEFLLSLGKEVIVVDNLFSGKIEHLNLGNPNLAFIESDILISPLLEKQIMRCDAVLHLAAIASVAYSIANPMHSFRANVQGFIHVLEAVRNSKRAIRLVYASSAAVYGDAELPCADTKPLTTFALSPYALQKRQNEEYAALYANLYGVSSLALRYFNVYGERQDPLSPYSGVISRFLKRYQANQDLVIFGDGRQSRDFIHVRDVAKANWMALKGDYIGALNVARGRPETLLDLINHIEAAGGKPAKIKFKPPQVGDIFSSYGTTEVAWREMGFQTTISLQEGIRGLMNTQTCLREANQLS